MKQQGQGQLEVQIGEKEAEGIYSNFVIISHNDSEFILDFTRRLPGIPKVKVMSRIIMAPKHAKALYAALQENIGKYESKFGEIKLAGVSKNQIGIRAPSNDKNKGK